MAARLILAILGTCALTGGLPPAAAGFDGEPQHSDRAAAAPARPVEAAAAPGLLTRTYGLPVVDLPAAPAFGPAPSVNPVALGSAASDAFACPISVRAIVSGWGTAAPFAVASVAGESRVLRTGHSVSTPVGRMRVAFIRADHIVLRRDRITVRCPLS